jgi:hypothetical protein
MPDDDDRADAPARRRPPARVQWLLTAGILGLAGVAVAVMVVVAMTSPPQNAARPTPAPSSAPASPGPGTAAGCPSVTVTVTTARELQSALDTVNPGSVIGLAPGVYQGTFTLRTSGTADAPVSLCGTGESILDGGGVQGGYVMHLDRVSFVHLIGFAVRNGQKGVMADQTSNSLLQGLTVSQIGDEAIHLRKNSTDNRVADNQISETGLRRPKFGEGIYIGTAESNWCDVSGCTPDRSDRNTIIGNRISATTAESVDIKEGTSDGILQHNSFDGSGIVSADSWVDVKGNGWIIDGNTGVNSPLDGFQTHEILAGWGLGNVFRNNRAAVNGPGYGYALKPANDNVVECSNTAADAGEGSSNVRCADG